MTARIEVRPATIADVPQLDALGARPAGTHRRRLSLQRADAIVYLVAVTDGRIAGHLVLTWSGSSEQAIRSRACHCPTIIDLFVAPELRCRGIGTALLLDAERRAGERRFVQIGLAVGITNNRAQALYERLGYRDADAGTFTVTWTEIAETGDEVQISETCVYLVKSLLVSDPTDRRLDRLDLSAADDVPAEARR